MKNTACVILAAGKGTRMKSAIPKPLHEIHSRPMLAYLAGTVKKAGVKDVVMVLGHGAREVEKRFSGYAFIRQTKQLGSGDAVNSAKRYFKGYIGDILVLYSDTPLISVATVKRMMKAHKRGNCGCTLLTTLMADPGGYGRIIRDDEGKIKRIVEEKDASRYEKAVREINVGAYVFDAASLFSYLGKVKVNRKKGEYYLTDIINIFSAAGVKIKSVTTDDIVEGTGVNDRADLAVANRIIKDKILLRRMNDGVTIVDPSTTHIDMDAVIGKDTIVYPNTVIAKDVVIGKHCRIGPFAHIRPGTRLGDNNEIGNFCELVRTTVGSDCKIKHMTYLGDAVLGSGINVGAGTITANYDGKNKNRTYIGDGSFIGIGTRLIAPVRVGKKAYVGAGSVVTKNHNVPDGATVIGIPAKIYKKSNGSG